MDKRTVVDVEHAVDTARIEASVAQTLGAMFIRAMSQRAVQEAYTAACRDSQIACPISQAIRIECRHVAQRRGFELVRAS